MSINLNTSGFNPNALSAMNPVSNLTTGLGSAVNSVQSGFMQQMSQLCNSLSQLFSLGGQNGQFQANQCSQNIGNGLGQGQQQMGNQGFNLGNLFGQGPQMANQGLNLGGAIGPGQQMGHQGYNLGNAFGQSQPPVNITINMGQPQPQPQPQAQGTQGCGTGNDSSQQPMTAGRASEVLNKHFDNLSGGDQTIDRGDLRRAANDPNSSNEVRQAANFLLNDSGAMRSLDTADSRARGGCEMADGRISKGDTGAAMATSGPLTQRDRNDVSVLQANSGRFAGADGLISKEEVAAVATSGRMTNGQQATGAEMEAAKNLTANPEKFNRLENTNFYRNPGDNNIPKSDGKIGMQDMQIALGQ